jgi:glycosyltransferase involved in cell wall biosynthesis
MTDSDSTCGIAVIPAYNEAAHVGNVVEELRETTIVDTVVVVDDNSTDETAARAAAAGATVVQNQENRNYGGAIKRGYSTALDLGADIVYRLDADGQHNPRNLYRFRDALADSACQYVAGNRFADPAYQEAMPLDRLAGNRIVALATSLRTKTRISDPPCGYRAMDASYLRWIPYEQFSDDFRLGVEEILAFHYLGAAITQVPVDCIYGDEESTLSYVDGVKLLYPIVQWWNTTKEFDETRKAVPSRQSDRLPSADGRSHPEKRLSAASSPTRSFQKDDIVVESSGSNRRTLSKQREEIE